MQRALLLLCTLTLACGTAREDSFGPFRIGDGERPVSIAVVPFGLAAGTPPPPLDVAEVIRAELAASGRYATVPVAEMPDHPTRLAEIRFEKWRQSKADYLVVGLVAGVHDGGHEVEFRLVDPREEKTLVGFLVASAPDDLDGTARRIAEMILQRIGVGLVPIRSDALDVSQASAVRTAPGFE